MFVVVEREACKVVRNDMYVACFVVLGLSCCARHLMILPLAICQIMVLPLMVAKLWWHVEFDHLIC